MEYHQDSLRLTSGSVLALFTDGVTEAGGTLDPREDARLVATVEKHAMGDANALAQAIFARAQELSGGSQRDDIAIVVLRCVSFPAPHPPRPSPLATITDGAWQR
jgi:serine phosphatase RsbU (regulator of sigma subunit)